MSNMTLEERIEFYRAKESVVRPAPHELDDRLGYGTAVNWDAPAGRQYGWVVGTVTGYVIVWNPGAGLQQKMRPESLQL